MIDDLTKQQIDDYFSGELNENDTRSLLQNVDSSEELKQYFTESEKLWDMMKSAEQLEPLSDYIERFWNNVSKDEEKNKKFFAFFEYFSLKWRFVGSLAVFLIIGTVVVNNFILEEEESGFVYEADDELLINNMDEALSKNTDESLNIFGPWYDLEN